MKQVSPSQRVETGPLQINDDWPGIFIRGDSALMAFAPALSAVLEGSDSPIYHGICKELLHLLQSCDARLKNEQVQLISNL